MIIYNQSDKIKGTVAPANGNQTKFQLANHWYKLDYLGYEGAAERAVTDILQKSNVRSFVSYSLDDLDYNGILSHGCLSKNFRQEGYRILTVEDLLLNYYGQSGTEFMDGLSVKDKIQKVVDAVESVTGFRCFGEYLTTLLELDALTLNEDRHFHNIAVLKHEDGHYEYCPIFDNGAAFLSDYSMDYPMEGPVSPLLEKVKAKPFSESFDEQVCAARELYGPQLCVSDQEKLISEEAMAEITETYGVQIANRISYIANLQKQRDKYILFGSRESLEITPDWESESAVIKIQNGNGTREEWEIKNKKTQYARDEYDMDHGY